MKVLVTGGAGFIGRHIYGELLTTDDHTPVVFDIAVDPAQDVRDLDAVRTAVGQVDAVIHLAAILGTQETIQDPVPVAETNLLGSLNVFEAAVEIDIPVVYAAVGNKWMRSLGTGAYTITKSAVEDFVEMYNQHRGGTISVVRPVNAYGPGQKVPAPYGDGSVRKIMVTFVHQALNGDPIEVYGDGSQVSDMVWVNDVARTFVAAIGRKGTYGVGPVQHYSVLEVAEMVQKTVHRLTGSTSPIVHLPMRPGETPGRTVVTDPTLFPDCDLLPLNEGIDLTVMAAIWRLEGIRL